MSQHKCARAMFFVYVNSIITVFVSYFKAVGFLLFTYIFRTIPRFFSYSHTRYSLERVRSHLLFLVI